MTEIDASVEIKFQPTGRVPAILPSGGSIFHLAAACRPALGPTQLRTQGKGWNSELITHLHPSPGLRMSGAMFISYIYMGRSYPEIRTVI
jgi:hypothetical protein